MRRSSWIFCVICLVSGCRLYEPPRYPRWDETRGKPSLRVLMIGDSLTYYNDLPGLLQQMSAREPNPIYIEQETIPNTSLKFHWELGQAQKRIERKKWDEVILQDYSREPIMERSQSIVSFERFNHVITKSGAKMVVFENWTVDGKEDEFDKLQQTYQQIQRETGATLAPIGAAWRLCRSTHPQIQLYVDDRHPSDEGTYLAACVLYDVLYHKPSAKLPMNLRGPDLPVQTMMTLRIVADQVVNAPSSTQPAS